MKNGEEVVSVGGAVEPSLKNVGTSASNSVLLDLGKVGVRGTGWIHSLTLSDIGRETECGCSCCEVDWWRPPTGRQDILHSQARPRVKMCQPSFSCCLLIGYKLGCQRDFDIPNDFTEASIEDIDQHLG